MTARLTEPVDVLLVAVKATGLTEALDHGSPFVEIVLPGAAGPVHDAVPRDDR
ncbi:hypothetical protein [Oerskovia turbata]|uniref:hypothetical protein n=1 Tax=Oerskovia turbata TaxID=1713 RepID=UPI000AFC2BA4|nr:hypothetical protein [Oerskovia turbata]